MSGGVWGDWAATLALVGGAEVIHFKGLIDDAINSFLAHNIGGWGRIHTCCWLPGAHVHKFLLIHMPTQGTSATAVSMRSDMNRLMCEVFDHPRVMNIKF